MEPFLFCHFSPKFYVVITFDTFIVEIRQNLRLIVAKKIIVVISVKSAGWWLNWPSWNFTQSNGQNLSLVKYSTPNTLNSLGPPGVFNSMFLSSKEWGRVYFKEQISKYTGTNSQMWFWPIFSSALCAKFYWKRIMAGGFEISYLRLQDTGTRTLEKER